MALTANALDLTARPTPQPGVVVVEVGGESVVLDGWREANVLSPSAARVWERLDGHTTLAEVADELAGLFDVDRDLIADDVVQLARQLGNLGLLDGVDPEPAENAPDIVAVPVPVVSEAGETIDDLEVLDIDGDPARLLDIDAASCLLVNWSPHCGYCASLLGDLARLDPLLTDAGTTLVLFAYGSAEASRTQAELSGWNPPVMLKPPHELGPFVGYGTPAAFHLDADGVLLSPAASGTKDVLRLAARLAGVPSSQSEPESPAGARHLLERGGSCGPGTGAEPVARWAGTRVYRIDDYNIGLRYTSEPTVRVLDNLFERKIVEDPGAGHIFTLALTDPDSRQDEPQENLLVIGSQLLVRSRHRERVLRALLWRLGDMMGSEEVGTDLVRVNATAVVTPIGAALLQPHLYTLEEHLQPAFARYGIAFVDVVNPQIDLEHAELVVPEPTVTHNPAVLERDAASVDISSLGRAPDVALEPDPVRPGRYPLVGWGVVHQADDPVSPLSPAQAAAATVSSVLDTEDQVSRVGELGDLFQRIDGFGLWYHSETQLADAVAEALGLAPLRGDSV